LFILEGPLGFRPTHRKLCPIHFDMVPKRIVNTRTVFEAMHGSRWIRDISGVANAVVLNEFLKLWDIIRDFPLQNDIQDTHIW
jgi:hypothetical protein